MRTHLGNSIVQCISRVTSGVQQGPGFTIESPDTRFEHGTVGAVQDSSDLESRQLAAYESVLADDLKPFVDQHCFEMRNVVGSGQGGGTGSGSASTTVSPTAFHTRSSGASTAARLAWTGA